MKFSKKVLKNGLVVLHEKRDVPVTTVMLGVKYGAAYETEDEKGIAHFIEHLCFKGTEKRTHKEIAHSLEKVGGILNAFTSEELTAYHVKLPSEHLELAMDVLFDVFFNPTFPDEEIEKERNVIYEEIRMYHDNPRMHVVETIKNNLYGKPFGMFIGGTEKTVKGIAKSILLEKHQEVYIPENSVLVVVGNSGFEEVLELAEKFVVDRKGKLPVVPEVVKENLQNKEERKDLQQSNLALGFHFPIASDENRYAAELFSAILGNGMSSKLFEEVREKRGLVYTVRSDLELGENYGYLVIYAGTDKQKVDEVVEICLKEFEKMGNLSEKELEEGKKQVMGNHDVESEGSDAVALSLILEEVVGKAENHYEFKKKIAKVSLDEIKKLAKTVKYSSFVLSN